MNKSIIAIIFSIMFATLTVMPNVLAMVGCDYDISILIDSNEEEEKKGEENVKNLELFFLDALNESKLKCGLKSIQNIEYFLKQYSKPHLNLVSPPPEIV